MELVRRAPAARPQEDAERVLILQAQRGDRPAFEQLIRNYESPVLRLALQMVRSEEEARDLYQEAFLKVYRSLPRFRFQSQFSTWVYRVVMNVCLDHLRRARTRREVQAAPAEDGEAEFFESLPEARPAANPERALQSREIARRLQQALGRLTPRERLVFELRHYQGLKLRAIGESCGMSEETAKNCLFRATQKLRSDLRVLL